MPYTLLWTSYTLFVEIYPVPASYETGAHTSFPISCILILWLQHRTLRTIEYEKKDGVKQDEGKRQKDLLLLLLMYLQPTKNLVHAAVQHISQPMPHVGVTMDTHLFVSTLAKEGELLQLWKAGPALGWGRAGMVCLCQSEFPLEFNDSLIGGRIQPCLQRGTPNVCCRMHKDVNGTSHLTKCCRLGPGACICNHRCLAERPSSAESNLLRSEEKFNLCCIEAISCPMPKPCLGLRKSLQDAYDRMFAIVIATTQMNLFKGSLYDFDCVSHDFLGQHAFQRSHSNLV